MTIQKEDIKSELVFFGVVEMSQDEKDCFAEEVRQDLNELFGENASINTVYKDIGKGFSCDVLTTTIVFGGLLMMKLFMQGKSIEDNLEAWPRLYKKLSNYIKSKKKQRAIHVSQPIALGYAVNHIIENNNGIQRLELIDSFAVSVGPMIGSKNAKFEDSPECVYSITVMADSREIHFIGLKSNLEIIYYHISSF